MKFYHFLGFHVVYFELVSTGESIRLWSFRLRAFLLSTRRARCLSLPLQNTAAWFNYSQDGSDNNARDDFVSLQILA